MAYFVCENCGANFSRWQGRCSFCGEWNTLAEIQALDQRKKKKESLKIEVGTLDEVSLEENIRIKSGLSEFDQVLGGGIVKGAMILLAGPPGIGKSTLALQIASNIGEKERNGVLYISGEESLSQIKLRAERIKIKTSYLKLSNQIEIDEIIGAIETTKPCFVILDSIQTSYSSSLPSVAGNISQVQYCALALQEIIKKLKIPLILIGHITKEGAIAGPKVLEHLVDVVLYFDGDPHSNLRILKGTKNRFGATFEVAIFEMKNEGFLEVKNPSQFLLEEKKEVSGSVVAATLEGTRPLLLEIQALSSKTNFGYPKRTSSGFDLNRLQVLLAVLQKRAGISFWDQDVYLNIVGGFKITEPALDLPICCALASARLDKIIPSDFVFLGEVGLSGEVRRVSQPDQRIKEAKKLGFSKIVIPHQNIQNISGLKIFKISSLKEAFSLLFKKG